MLLYQIEKADEYRQRREANDAKRLEYERKCQSCGACCSYYAWSARCMQVHDGPLMDDATYTFKAKQRIKWIWPDGVSKTETHLIAFLRRRKVSGWWHCIALEGQVGQSVKCAVYDKRPSTCRDFQPGSMLCIKAREWADLEVHA